MTVEHLYTAHVETPEEQRRRLEMDRVVNIQYEVARLLKGFYGRMDWIARQTGGGYCFVIGKGSAYVTDEEVANPPPELYLRLAAEIAGWELGSKQDIEHRRAFVQKRLDENMIRWEALSAEVRRDISLILQLTAQEAT